MGIECNLIHQLTNLRRQLHGHARTRRPAHRTPTNDPRHAKYSASRARKTKTQKPCVCSSRRACKSRPETSGLVLGLAGARSVKSAQHGTRESGRAKGMHGQRSGTPARRRCRRGTRRHKHPGGQLTPCSRSEHLRGTPGRVGRNHAGPERPLWTVIEQARKAGLATRSPAVG